MSTKDQTLIVRVEAELLARLDRTLRPGESRSDAIRAALDWLVQSREQDAAPLETVPFLAGWSPVRVAKALACGDCGATIPAGATCWREDFSDGSQGNLVCETCTE